MADRAPTLSVSELDARLQAFEREFLREKSAETIGTYRRSLSRFEAYVREAEGSFRFDTPSVEAYKRYLVDECGLQPASVSTYLTALRQFCAYLVQIGFLPANPASAVKGNARPQEHARRALTREEVDRLEAAFDTGTTLGRRDRAMARCMLYAGLSEIEIIRSEVGDLEQTLLGTMLRVQGKGRRRKDQRVPLDPPVMEAIWGYLAVRGPYRSGDALFVSHGRRSGGDRLNTRSVRGRMNDLLRAAGLKAPGVTPHSLTHTAPVLWLEHGMSIEDVRRRMRHGTLETTMLYQQYRIGAGSEPETSG